MLSLPLCASGLLPEMGSGAAHAAIAPDAVSCAGNLAARACCGWGERVGGPQRGQGMGGYGCCVSYI